MDINNEIIVEDDISWYNNFKLDQYSLYEIFRYVPVCERPKLALVCKMWKDVVLYFMFKDETLEMSFWQNNHQNTLNENVPVVYKQFSLLNSLLSKCGRYLTTLDFSDFGDSIILPVINEQCPNLQKLKIRLEVINKEDLDNAFRNLHHLRFLIVLIHKRRHDTVPMNLINSLTNLSNSLAELCFLNLNASNSMLFDPGFPNETVDVIKSLRSLQLFEVARLSMPNGLLTYLQGASLKMHIFDNIYFDNCGGYNYRYSTNLSFANMPLTDNFWYFSANITPKVQTLEIASQLLTINGVKAIVQMKYLKNLFFYGRSNLDDSAIKLLKNLNKLKLPQSQFISDKSVKIVLQNSPQMVYLSVKNTSVSYDFINQAARICMSRTSVLLLCCKREVHNMEIDSFKYIQNNLYVFYDDKKKGIYFMKDKKLPTNVIIVPHQRYIPTTFGSSASAVFL